jgi:CRISPR-associated protein (TIGR03986 family)
MYSVAPYNFIPLPERVFARYQNETQIPGHDKFDKALNTGRITFEIEALSPLLIGKDRQNVEARFAQNHEGEYIIPGSTLRGWLRSNVQILGMCCVKDDVEDSLFLYRELADQNTSLRNYYQQVVDISPDKSDEGNIKAGYIYKDDDEKYYIQPAKTVGGHTYFSVNELNFLLYPERYQTPHGMNLMYQGFNVISGEAGKITNDRWKKHTEFFRNLNLHYHPYIVEGIAFDLAIFPDSAPKIKQLSKNGQYRGCLLGSGKMTKKKCHYVINEIDDQAETIPIDKKSVLYYEADLNRNKQKENLYMLPEEKGKAKPVFYAEINGRLYFGFTPHLRIYYKHSVHDGLPESMRNFAGVDYAMAMFGFIKEKVLAGRKEIISFKSRLCFMDGKCMVANNTNLIKSVVLGQPKATCYPDYLQQDNRDKRSLLTYNADHFRLRGVKQYWLKTKMPEELADNKNSNVITKMYPLDVGSRFHCELCFANLHDDELGLLLLALILDQGCKQNIGMGKPLGFGKIKIHDVRVYVDDFVKKYSAFSAAYREEKAADDYIKAFEEYLKNSNENDYKQYETIKRDLIHIKSHEMTPEASRYMMLKEFSQRNRLKTILQYREDQGGDPASPMISGGPGKPERQNGPALPDRQNHSRPYQAKSRDNQTGKSAMELALEKARRKKEGKP